MFFSSVSRQHRLGGLSFGVFKAAFYATLGVAVSFALPAQALEFTPLKGGYGASGELKLQSQVRQLPTGSESQLRSTCLRASIKNSAPASQYSSDTEPVPMLVDFDASGRAAGVVHLKASRSVSDPVSIVTLRSDCPLAVFEVSWTVFLTPASDPSGGKEPRWDMDPGPKLAVASNNELREFSLKDSSLLGKSSKPNADGPVLGQPSAETRMQMTRLKNELQKTNTSTVAVPEKIVPNQNSAQYLAADIKPDPVAKTLAQLAKVAVPEDKPTAQAAKPATRDAPAPSSTPAPTNVPELTTNSDVGLVSEQTGLMLGDNITPSPAMQEQALAPAVVASAASAAPLDDLDRLNKTISGPTPEGAMAQDQPGWVMYGFAAAALLLMLFGAFWAYQRFRLKSSVMPKYFFDRSKAAPSLMDEPITLDDVQRSDDEDEPLEALDSDSAVHLKSDHEVAVGGPKNGPRVAEKDATPKEFKMHLVEPMEAEPVAEVGAARLFESMLGADEDGRLEDLDHYEPGQRLPHHDVRHREGLDVTLHALQRTAVKPWKLPVAYASLIAARNRSLSFELSSHVLRCEVGLLELAFQETRRGRLLDQAAVDELVSMFMPEPKGEGLSIPSSRVPDIVKSHLKTKRYELNGADAQNRFKANCLQLKTLCQVWSLCFVLPEWSQLVEEGNE